jgi:hypothetical protein
MAAGRSKKVTEIASERDEEVRGLWRWLALAASTLGASYSWTNPAFTPP